MRAACFRRRWLADCGECRSVGRRVIPYGAALLQLALLQTVKRVRGERLKPAQGVRWSALEGETPRELSGCPLPKQLRPAWNSREGQNLEVGVQRTGPLVLRGCGRSYWTNGMQVQSWSKGLGYLSRAASKGKSQERCRDETSPARLRGE
jgi:hypothetical protein